jgi:hypothetical protein
MGTLEPMGKTHIHIDAGHGVLEAFRFVQNRDGIPDIFYSDFVDLDSSMIPLILNVIHGYLPE